MALIAWLSALTPQLSTFAQGTAFTYQGRLNDGGGPLSGSYDLTFTLYDGPGVLALQIGSPQPNSAVPVNAGLFTVTLDFSGGAFTGAPRWLEIAVQPHAGGATTTLSPRQQLTPAPYAITAGNVNGLLVQGNATSPNLIGGYSGNIVSNGVVGAVIGGGGVNGAPNLVTDNYGTVSGGTGNQAGNNNSNPADNLFATVGGGHNNVSGNNYATIGGGLQNAVNGDYGTVGGGVQNTAYYYSTVAGGFQNSATAFVGTVGGGKNNLSSGNNATVPGGVFNQAAGDFSLAAGQNAQALHTGAFVWADDSSTNIFASTAANQFLIRATGGVGINTNNPNGAALNVNGTVTAINFSGSGAGLTSLNPASLSAGTAAVSISGNAATATLANNFSGSLAGDLTGMQSATVVASVGGQSAANAATSVNAASTIVKRDASGNFSAGAITARSVSGSGIAVFGDGYVGAFLASQSAYTMVGVSSD
jgi:hypothetical protein